MRTVLLLLFFLQFLRLSGQGYFNTMVFGYEGGHFSPNNDDFGLNLFTFTNGSLEISDDQSSDLEFNDTAAAISDENGNLLFYFNGISVYDASHHVMDNGDTLNEFNQFGFDLPQGAIILPYPEKPDIYLLFYCEEGYYAPWGLANVAVYYATIDMAKNNGLGKVVNREKLVVADSLEYGKLAVVRHANGRDWWLAIGEAHQNAFYRVLVDPYGVHLLGKQSIGIPRAYGIGESFFSPDGTKYVMFSAIVYNEEYHYLDIYDFDRCTGFFNNHEHFHIPFPVWGGGGIIAPNSRWLYVTFSDFLYKYDLWANTVQSSEEWIATYEPFNDPFPTKFHRGYLAPDDKIYIVTTSGSRTLHVIHKPDEAGAACDFEQHGIRLPCHNGNSIPTFANYRLGPLDGSLCDSLGINNVPVAWWRYEQDTVQRARFEFRDLSYHEPANWYWDFGDGTSSTERHPVHEYAGTGAYEACLTVSNAHGSHTHCKTLYSTVALQDDPALLAAVQVGPNPFAERIQATLSVALRNPVLRLFDQLGRLVGSASMAYGITEMDTEALPAGLYFWEIRSAGEPVKAGKLVKRRD